MAVHIKTAYYTENHLKHSINNTGTILFRTMRRNII